MLLVGRRDCLLDGVMEAGAQWDIDILDRQGVVLIRWNSMADVLLAVVGGLSISPSVLDLVARAFAWNKRRISARKRRRARNPRIKRCAVTTAVI